MSTELLIEVYSKNFSLVKEVRLHATAVPRVGEYVALPPTLQEWVGNLTHALVHEVEWLLDNDTLLPVVRCHALDHTAASNRLNCLEELGWLQPSD